MRSLPQHARPITWLVLISAAALLCWRLWILALASAFDPSATVDIILDDAYYYLQVAYNLGLHGRSTYDGITSTNGYQPAWMLLLAGVETLLRLEKKGLFVALEALIALTMALPLLFCLRRYRDPFYLGLSAGLAASYGSFPGIYVAGLETVLFAPAFVAVAHAARHGLRTSAPRVAWLFALIVWIRLDAVSLLVAYAVPLAYGPWKEQGFRAAAVQLGKFMAPSLVSLAVYAFPNWLLFGAPVPLSGVAKAVGSQPFANWGILYNYLLQAIPVIPPAIVVLVVELRWSKFRGGQFTYAGIAILLGSLLAHYAYYALFSGWIPWPWYFYVYALIVVLLTARLVEVALELADPAAFRARVISFVFVAIAALLFPALTYGLLTKQLWDNQHRPVVDGSFNRRNVADALEFARAKRALTVAIGDRAAGLGYWSPPYIKVFAMEGLVSSKAYLDARRRDEGERWIRENIAPQLLIIDREALEPVRIGAEERYVIIEPIQGRVVFDHLLTYCFRKEAVVRRKIERDNQLVVLPAPAARVTFDFRQAEVCSGAFAEYARNAILSTESLRRSAVPTEYADVLGGAFNAALERFDRTLALKLRALRGG